MSILGRSRAAMRHRIDAAKAEACPYPTRDPQAATKYAAEEVSRVILKQGAEG